MHRPGGTHTRNSLVGHHFVTNEIQDDSKVIQGTLPSSRRATTVEYKLKKFSQLKDFLHRPGGTHTRNSLVGHHFVTNEIQDDSKVIQGTLPSSRRATTVEYKLKKFSQLKNF